MIEHLRGILVENDGNHLVVEAGGVGYGADVPLSTGDRLPAVGEEVSLHTYLYLQEGIMRLYGFLTREEREVFQVFLGVSGIGPKIALGILSSVRISDFIAAILRNDIPELTKIPGVGKKTAERLVVELRDKVKELSGRAGQAPTPAAMQHLPGSGPAAVFEVAAALQALGCKLAVADRAAQRAWEHLGDKATLEELVREALKHRY
jgi:Holliday junction DNA helicase RuvA